MTLLLTPRMEMSRSYCVFNIVFLSRISKILKNKSYLKYHDSYSSDFLANFFAFSYSKWNFHSNDTTLNIAHAYVANVLRFQYCISQQNSKILKTSRIWNTIIHIQVTFLPIFWNSRNLCEIVIRMTPLLTSRMHMWRKFCI